jgi:quinol monooxygenase YgiN
MILVTGSFIAKEGHFGEALVLSLAHVRRSRLEEGCIAHSVHLDAENPSRLVFIEHWANQAALDEHFAVPASRAFVKAATKLAAAPPDLSVFEATRVNL